MKSKINKEILRLAVPNIISNISVPLLSTVDTILMGSLSSLHLGAIGIGSMIFNIIYWNFGFLRMGTTGITAQNFGAKEDAQVWLSFLRASALAILISVILLVFQIIIYKAGVWSLNISPDTQPLVKTYFDIRIWAAPASLMLMVIMGWMFGVQNAIYPLILTVVINVVNIILSVYLVYYQNMEVAGVAIGTVIAQYIGVLVGLWLIYWKYKDYYQNKVYHLLNKIDAYGRFMKVNFDLFLRTVCLTFAFGFFYSQSSKISDTVLAVNVVLMQYINWMSYGIDGFAYACESLIGKYKGAKEKNALLITISQSFLWGGLVSLLYAFVYYVFGDELFAIFSDDASLSIIYPDLLIYMAIFPLMAFASYIWDGIFIGLTATSSMRNAMVGALILFLATYYILPAQSNGSHIWIALTAFMVYRAALQYLYYKKDGIEMV